MAKPLISVIIPTYNSATYLPQALDSVFAQTHNNLEVLVIDDGSTDNTPAVIAPYANRIVYMRQAQAGPSKARNLGIARARGIYTAFLDADDTWLPSKLEKQLRVLQHNPEVGMVYSRSVNFHNRTGEELGIHPKKMHSGILFDFFLTTPVSILSSVLVRTCLLKELGGFEEGLTTAEDTHLYLRIARNYKIVGVPDILVRRRIHDKNLSGRIDVQIGTLDCLDHIARLYPETNPKIYSPMAKAYQSRGKSMMLDLFHSGAYAYCNQTGRHLISLRVFDFYIMAYYLLTLLPRPLIETCRRMKQHLSKA